MKLADLNTSDPQTALNAIGTIFEHSAWAAGLLLQERPFHNLEDLRAALKRTVRQLPLERRVELIAAHPELGQRRDTLATASKHEQSAAGVAELTAVEQGEFARLNAAYRERFGFPFVICAREHTKDSIHAALTARIMNERDAEISTATDEIAKIATLRLLEIVTG